MEKKKIIFLIVFFITLIIIIINIPNTKAEFAKCLNKNNFILYGNINSEETLKQKEIFGNTFKKINYVECNGLTNETMNQECKDKEIDIERIPILEFGDINNRLYGFHRIEDITAKTGCNP